MRDLDKVLTAARACRRCGQAHKQVKSGANSVTFADPVDGHAYQPRMVGPPLAELERIIAEVRDT